ncbi:acyl-CoA dehydrogenase [Desulfosporosinus orientis DSM 765]|uniref:Acyl-CoA dehydrogenase n=1 Tax=Desulfosporosinus orientis (strain ATCC 19365 / DSM 765 / NCIMB 8382 / VKM B-1628 / Singapore I) TaxID=768706 RepID=G7WGP9_DESOD|nr:acyl-CoA dehydrogenase family protein [Desulfosporosinus orientis]AET68485.1 acyl-CoA dehydrogenase [Desulfosporosinus orientis DSM 765]
MSFEFAPTQEQVEMLKMVRKFVKKEIIPVRAYYDEEEEFPWPVFQKMAEIGVLCMSGPESISGYPWDNLTRCLVMEELARGCGGIATTPMANILASEPIEIAGTAEQKKWWFSGLCLKGEMGAYCVTEPGAGSDVAGLSSSVRREGNHYVLNGTKCFISNGGVASKYVVLARLNKSAGAKGLTFFLVDRHWDGVSHGKKEKKMGNRASDTSEVIFTDVKVPEEYLLGEEGGGFKIAMNAFNMSRPVIGAMAVGVSQFAMETARDYARERKQFGTPIANMQAVQFMLAEMDMRIEAARLLYQKAAWMLDKGLEVVRNSALAKCFGADMAQRVTSDAVQILGGYGYTREYPLEKAMRDAKLLQIVEGTSQIQKMIIAREILK